MSWSTASSSTVYELSVAHLSSDGTLLNTRMVDTDGAAQTPSSLAWDGSNYLLAWNAGIGPDGQMYGLRLDQQGEPIDSGKFFIGSRSSFNSYIETHELGLAAGPEDKLLVTYSTFDADAAVQRVKARLITDDNVNPPSDTIPPVITCPGNVTVHALSQVKAQVFTGAVSDNSDPNPVVAHVSDVAAGTNPIQITRTYRASDLSGNVAFCTQLITVETIPGDFNGDGRVDLSDLNLLMIQIRAHSTDPAYDVNGDGKVDIADARSLALHFSNPN